MSEDEGREVERTVAVMEGYGLGYAEGYERRKKDEEVLVKSLVKRVRELFGQAVEAEKVLGKALGYPRFCDDPNGSPRATPEDGVYIGEHTLVTLAEEAAEGLRKVEVWETVPEITMADGLEMHADGIAVTVGLGNTALATHRWPDDGYEYAVVRRKEVPHG